MPMERVWHVNLTSGDGVSSGRSSSESIPSPPGFIERELTTVSCAGKVVALVLVLALCFFIGGC